MVLLRFSRTRIKVQNITERRTMLTRTRKNGKIRAAAGESKTFPKLKKPLIPRIMLPAIKTPKDSTWGKIKSLF